MDEVLREAWARSKSKAEGSQEARMDAARRLLDATQAAVEEVLGARLELPAELEARLARELARKSSMAALRRLLGLTFEPARARRWPKVARPRLVEALAKQRTGETSSARACAARALDALDAALAQAQLAPLPRGIVDELARRILRLHGQRGFFRRDDLERLGVTFDLQRAEDVLSTLLELVPVVWTDDVGGVAGPSRVYSPAERFAVGEAVEHAKLGRGVVVEVGAADVIIVFSSGPKKLVHGAG